MAVEQTLSIIKPDGVQKNLIGEIYKRFEDAGLEIVAAKMKHLSDKEAQAILGAIQEGVEKPKPKVLYQPGEVVRVTEGPFNDFNGVVE